MKRCCILLWVPLLLAGCMGGLGRPGSAKGSGGNAEGRIFPENAPAADELPEDALYVAEYAPTGVVPWENFEGGVWALFSRPVVPLARLKKPASTSEAMSISPAVPGIFRWYGTRLLSFEPAGPLDPAVEYTVLLNPKQAALDGAELAGLNAFRFRTPALELLSLEPSGGDVAPEDCRTLQLAFNYPVDLDTVGRSLKVEAAGRQYPVAMRWLQPKAAVEPDRRVVLLELKKELPWDTDVSVRLLEGAKPAPDKYGTFEEQSLGFHTLEPFRVERAEVYDWLPTVEAGILFNHPVGEQEVLSRLKVELPGYRLEGNLQVFDNQISLRNLPVSFESSFRLTVLAGLKDIYGQGLPADRGFELEVGPAASYVHFRAAGDRILEAGFPPVVAVEFQNILSGSWAAGPLGHPFQELPEGPSTAYEVQKLPRNTRLFRTIDFSPYLNEEGKGSAFARWKFMVPSWWSEEPYEQAEDLRLQVTDLSLSSHLAHNRFLVWVTRLSSGLPEPGVEVVLRGASGEWKRAVTDGNGLAALALQQGELSRFFDRSEESMELEARKGRDRLVLRPADSPSYSWNFKGPFTAEAPVPLTYLCSDRGIYRPGETLSYLGIDRDRVLGELRSRRGGYTVELWQGWSEEKVVARRSGTLTSSGRFWGELALPESLEPDDYLLVYSRAGESYRQQVPVKIAFFRRVTYSVELNLPEGPRYIGDRLEARFAGKYLAGGNLNRGRWSYWWARREVAYEPPDPQGAYEGFRFGAGSGGAEYYDEYYGDEYEGYYEDLSRDEGALGGDGSVTAVQKLAEGRPGRVYSYELTTTIEDVDRQAISKRASLPVFTSELLIGARPAAAKGAEEPLYFVKAKEPFYLQACTVDPEGTPYAAGALEGRLIRETWKMVREKSIGGRVDTRWVREEILERGFTLNPPGRKDGKGRLVSSVELRTGDVGAYWIELRGKDGKGREALTRIDFYSTGSANVLWQRYDESRIDLVLDKRTYAPGEKAKLLIKSPLERGRYLLTVERDGILEERFLDLEGSTHTVEIDIREQYIPVVYVSLSGGTGRTAAPPDSPDLPDLGKPRGSFGWKAVPVDADKKRISLEIIKRQASYRPGSAAELTVRATWQGKPLEGAEIALIAVDRGVLDLINYHVPDPLGFFYNPGRYADMVSHYDSRELLLDPVVWKVRDLPGGDKEGEELAEEGLQVRRDFRATAVFEPSLVTGKDGTASVRFKLPDSLTRFRTSAVAAKGELFGLAEEELLVQNPLNVRAALPRLLRFGDEAQAGVIVTNLDAQARAVTVRLASDLLELLDKQEKRVTLKAGESREVAFRFSARRAGRAFLRFDIQADVLKERLEAELMVEQSTIREAFTIIGQTEDSVREGLAIPESFLGTPGEGLRLSLDSTIASSLIEAIRFLAVYPYDCLEQRASKLFAYILYDWLLEYLSQIEQELNALALYQVEGGGFSFWQDPGFRHPNYYVSLRTAHLLHLAARRGYSLPEGLDVEALLAYLRREYTEAEPALKAYALYVLSQFGQDVRSEAAGLVKVKEKLGIVGLALLGQAQDELGQRQEAQRLLAGMRNFLRVGTRSVTLIQPAESWHYFGGDLQAKALLLMLYRRLEPQSQLVQALADDLLASHRKGYWYNTSNTGWVLQAFAEYLGEGGEREADFRAKVKLGSSAIASAAFKGLSKQPYTQTLDPAALRELARRQQKERTKEGLPLVVSKEGRGRLYYTASLSYALDAAQAEAREEGIGLSTEILDAQGKTAGDTLRLGQVYRVKVVVYTTRDRDFLALRLPVPAGAEVIDGSLATSQAVRMTGEEPEEGDYEYDRPIMRIYDAEVRFFFDSFYRGKTEFSFMVRTTTPGTFRTPPAVAELMYEEEVFGRTAGQVYRIVP